MKEKIQKIVLQGEVYFHFNLKNGNTQIHVVKFGKLKLLMETPF